MTISNILQQKIQFFSCSRHFLTINLWFHFQIEIRYFHQICTHHATLKEKISKTNLEQYFLKRQNMKRRTVVILDEKYLKKVNVI